MEAAVENLEPFELVEGGKFGQSSKLARMAQGHWIGLVETELFAQTCESYGLATVRYPVLEVEARVELIENGRGFSQRVLRAGKPREGEDEVGS